MNVLYTDFGFADISVERRTIEGAGAALLTAQCRSEAEVIEAGRGAAALLVQWAPITRAVIEHLQQCRHIVRVGIGVDNVDLAAATDHGIAVSNVPDYCLDEVADHTVSLSLALARQIVQLDKRVRSGVWRITPDSAMPAFRAMTFATIGFGRIARAVHERVQAFGFTRVAFDPNVPDSVLSEAGVRGVELDEAIQTADILSLHLPLTGATRHLLNAERFGSMKSNAIVVNTARGGLVDTIALADALRDGTIAGAGLDVFEQEPLPDEHPIRTAPNALLTSHVAWYSESSVPELQRRAAEEVARGLSGEPLRYRIN